MALESSVSGSGILVSNDTGEPIIFRVYDRDGGGGYTQYQVTTTVVVTEWLNLTESAATTWVAGELAAGESRKIERVSFVSGGEYKAVKTVTTKTQTQTYVAPE